MLHPHMKRLALIVLSLCKCLAFTPNSNADIKTPSDASEHTLKITHQEMVTTIPIHPSETILQALERSRAHDILSLPSLPHDCRRGNCLTCSARVMPSAASSVQVQNDGLAPSVKKKILENGMIPTCSTYVTGDVDLEIGVADVVWKKIWEDEDDGVALRREASAKAIRLNDEQNIHLWKRKMEKLVE